jgi:hypothetical protein
MLSPCDREKGKLVPHCGFGKKRADRCKNPTDCGGKLSCAFLTFDRASNSNHGDNALTSPDGFALALHAGATPRDQCECPGPNSSVSDARAGRFIHRLSTDAAAFRSPGVLELKESNFRRIAWFWRRASVSASSSLSSEPLQSSRTQPKCHNHHEVGYGSGVFVPVFRGLIKTG